MKPNRAALALLMPVSLFAVGCGEDVGPCPSDSAGMSKGAGYDTVQVGAQVQYGGQAIINQSCANGICHSSAAKGAARRGAPADLNFDLRPVGESGVESSGDNDKGYTVAKLKQEEVRGLRERQRKVFEERNSIWQQVKDGDMPPPGMFASFRKLASIFDTDEAMPCTRAGKGFADITTKASQDVLRTWLACSVPIVEVNSTVVEVPGSAGTAGYQYQVCGGEVIDTDGGTPDGGGVVAVPVTLKDLLADEGAFGTYACAACHPAVAKDIAVDLTDEAKAHTTLTATKAICNGKPYVTPGDPAKSFLIDVISKDDPGCDAMRMPMGQDMTAAEIKKVSDWIQGGAKKSTDKSLGGLDTGLDAGVR